MTEEDEENNTISCKVVLIGNSGVGKTSIINQYISDEFNDEQITTTGSTFCTKIMKFEEKNAEISFEIWDTAGQEKYRCLTKIFYKNASIIILVYDITRKDSFEDIKNYWFNEIKESSNENIILAIVGNKSDLINEEEVNENEVRNYAEEKGMFFYSTSAKMKEGINELFNNVGLKFLEKYEQNNDDIFSSRSNTKIENVNNTTNEKKRNCCK
jgi:small GTP-binding protein